MVRQKWDSERKEEIRQEYKEMNGKEVGGLKRRHMISCVQRLTLRKEKRICIVRRCCGIEQERMGSRLGWKCANK